MEQYLVDGRRKAIIHN